MTAVEQAVRDRLVASTTVTDHVGSRVHPFVLPQTPTLPAAVYQRISTTAHHSHNGSSRLDATRLQIDVWADDYPAARQAAVAIRSVLDGIRRESMSGLWVYGVLFDGGDDRYEDDTRLWRARGDYRIWHRSEE